MILITHMCQSCGEVLAVYEHGSYFEVMQSLPIGPVTARGEQVPLTVAADGVFELL